MKNINNHKTSIYQLFSPVFQMYRNELASRLATVPTQDVGAFIPRNSDNRITYSLAASTVGILTNLLQTLLQQKAVPTDTGAYNSEIRLGRGANLGYFFWRGVGCISDLDRGGIRPQKKLSTQWNGWSPLALLQKNIMSRSYSI